MEMFKYNGESITFELSNGEVMVNATQMGRSFDKSPTHFLRNEQTLAFISALRNRIPLEPVKVINGDKGGTWMHQKLALKFAAWLNPEFELWVYDRIEELIKHGATAINPEDLLNPDFIIQLATELKNERAEKQAIQARAELQSRELKEAAPKVEYYNEVLQSGSLISVTEMANTLGFRSARSLNLHLQQQGIIRKVNGSWALTAKYSGRQLAKYKTYPYTDSKGEIQTARNMYFTESGQKFLIDHHAKRSHIQSN